MIHLDRERVHRLVTDLHKRVNDEGGEGLYAYVAASTGLAMLATILEPETSQVENQEGPEPEVSGDGLPLRDLVINAAAFLGAAQPAPPQAEPPPPELSENPDAAVLGYQQEEAAPAAPMPEEADAPAAPVAADDKWPEARNDLLRKMWRDSSLSGGEMHRRINALPGGHINNSASLWHQAKKLGLGLRTEAPAPLPPVVQKPPVHQPIAAPVNQKVERASAHNASKGATLPAANPLKAQAFECFAAGMHGRAVVDKIGCSLADASNWASEWRETQKRGRANDAAQQGA